MSRLTRALLITAVATGAAAVVLTLVRRRPAFPPPLRDVDTPGAEADRMTAEEQQMLLNELAAQL